MFLINCGALRTAIERMALSIAVAFPVLASGMAHALIIGPSLGVDYTSNCDVSVSKSISSIDYSVSVSTAGTNYAPCSAVTGYGSWMSLTNSGSLSLGVGATGSAFWRVFAGSDYELLRTTYIVASNARVDIKLTRFQGYSYELLLTDLVYESGATWDFFSKDGSVTDSFFHLTEFDYSLTFNFNNCHLDATTNLELCLAPPEPPGEGWYYNNQGVEVADELSGLSTVPVPATLPLMGLALTALSFFRRKNSKI